METSFLVALKSTIENELLVLFYNRECCTGTWHATLFTSSKYVWISLTRISLSFLVQRITDRWDDESKRGKRKKRSAMLQRTQTTNPAYSFHLAHFILSCNDSRKTTGAILSFKRRYIIITKNSWWVRNLYSLSLRLTWPIFSIKYKHMVYVYQLLLYSGLLN